MEMEKKDKLPNTKTVLVTGAAGLIGSEVSKMLLADGNKVVATDNFSIGKWRSSDDQIFWEVSDIQSDAFLKRLGKYRIDFVIHCAAHPCAMSLTEAVKDVEVNALGSIRLFDWCVRNGVPVIYTSSNTVYGNQPPGPISEDAPLDIGNIYGACKIACENFLKVLEKGHGLKWVALRLFSTYGAGHRPSTQQGIVNVMLTQLLKGPRVIVKGSLERERDLLYVKDAARAICACIENDHAFGNIMNIASGVPTTIGRLIEKLGRILGYDDSEIQIIEEEGTPGDPFYNVANCRKAENLLGFSPKYDLDTGLREFVQQRLG
jgi:UDP-glucose 4-epimerase